MDHDEFMAESSLSGENGSWPPGTPALGLPFAMLRLQSHEQQGKDTDWPEWSSHTQFDDGWKSSVVVGGAILNNVGIEGTFYIISGTPTDKAFKMRSYSLGDKHPPYASLLLIFCTPLFLARRFLF